MKKQQQLMLRFLLTGILLMGFGVLQAQDARQEKAPRIVILTTWESVMPPNGSAAERDALLSEWVENILLKNDKILSQKNYGHYYGSSLRDWVVITEYENWNAIDEANKLNQQLMKAHWPEEKDRQMFFRMLSKYFIDHSDEILMEKPKYNKE